MTAKNDCSKCGGAMTNGFIIDHGDYEYVRQQLWVEGEPEASFWSGIKTSGRATFNARALRCTGCGFLEFYADDRKDLDVESYKIFN